MTLTVKNFWKITGYIAATLFIFSVCEVLLLRFVPVVYTPLMSIRHIEALREGKEWHLKKKWTPLKDISPQLQKAVIASEDSRFYEHNGFSWEGIKNAIEEKRDGNFRHGGSTISQQTAKNVFCLPHRSYIRKAVEAYYTVLIELLWGKERILEVYLNVAETGDGMFGAEAAARQYFGVSANRLNSSQAALIAVSLPNPRKMHPSRPSLYMLKQQQVILRRMRVM